MRRRNFTIAFFSPLPPARSGIADYSEALLAPLRALADVQTLQTILDRASEQMAFTKKLLAHGARVPKELMLFVKNLMFLNAATAMLAVVPAFAPGVVVRLSTGDRGVVVGWDAAAPCRPTVRIIDERLDDGQLDECELTLKDLAEQMRDIDIAMLSTHTEGGKIASRPMSNNRQVDYDGDSYYFTYEDALMVADIQAVAAAHPRGGGVGGAHSEEQAGHNARHGKRRTNANHDSDRREHRAIAQAPNGGLIVTGSPAATVHRELINGLALKHKLPIV